MSPSSPAPPPAARGPRGDAAWRHDARLAAGVAGLVASAWSLVVLVKLGSSADPLAPGLLLLAAVFHGCGEFSIVAVMLLPIVALHRRLPVVAGAAPGTPAAAGAALPALAGLAALSTALGVVLSGLFVALDQGGADRALSLVPYLVMRQGTLAVLMVALAELRLRHLRAAAALHEAGVRSLALRRELDTAQLALLSAQIEPHFLFNALANVRRLLRTEPPAAQQLLAQLRRYLEEALPLLREPVTTLGREAELVQAYLGVHQVRMGPRLAATVQVPPALRGHPLPPMLLLTLVENAIKHGLAPLAEGGAITVSAAREGDELVLRVADTGRGMGSGMGSGMGLANLQHRLRTQHGPAARLALHVNEPRGVVAEVRLPWQAAAGGPAP